ncbi:MAG: FHA domain-containing protein [Myxococcales bacterium]|nr:FHA domain-containing protein [Myxococcales bacterium]
MGEDAILVGRSSECRIRLVGGLVSRRHARIDAGPEGPTVEDLGSRNGVLVNHRRIGERTLLRHGDRIVIGIEALEVIDALVVARAENLSTIPPARAPAAGAGDEEHESTLVARVDLLSPREREVLKLIALGHTQREIGALLSISVKTVETHRAHIAHKVGCETRAALVSYAISAGVLDLAPQSSARDTPKSARKP